jgi:hypothetical protein
MVSEVSICNQAMSWLGQPEMTTLDDKTTHAQWCRNNYPFLRDAVLEERMWTFATVRATSTVADRDEWDTMFKHPIPVGWISVFKVYRDVSQAGEPIPDREWRMEEGNVLSRCPTVYLWGIERVTDTGKFSPLFVQALAARLAADAAIPVTNNREMQSDMWSLYVSKLAEAAARDGQQGSIEKTRSDTLIRARGGFGYGNG